MIPLGAVTTLIGAVAGAWGKAQDNRHEQNMAMGEQTRQFYIDARNMTNKTLIQVSGLAALLIIFSVITLPIVAGAFGVPVMISYAEIETSWVPWVSDKEVFHFKTFGEVLPGQAGIILAPFVLEAALGVCGFLFGHRRSR